MKKAKKPAKATKNVAKTTKKARVSKPTFQRVFKHLEKVHAEFEQAVFALGELQDRLGVK